MPSGRLSGIRCLKFYSSRAEGEHVDIEKGPPDLERVILRIGGLRCGCCEGGITRIVGRISAIKNHQVNTVLAKVEFDLDTSRLSVDDVIIRLSHETGYVFEEHVPSLGQVLEFNATDPAQLHHAGKPQGVIRIEAPLGCTKPQICRQPTWVHYDATKIGARDVFDYYQMFDYDLRLAPPAAHPSLAVDAKQTRRALYLFLPTLAFTVLVVRLARAPINHDDLVYAHVSLVAASIVQLIAFADLVPSVVRSLYHSHVFEMGFLIALSTTIAYIFSVVSYVYQVTGKPLETGPYFETSTLLVTFILLGRVINEFARFRAAKSVSFRSLQNNEALLVVPGPTTPTDPKTRKIDARLLQYNDLFKVPPHTRVVTDGIILWGGSEVDESTITGESIPVAKGVHSTVFAGTTNGSGVLIVKVTTLPHENSVHKIAAVLEAAQLTKPKTQAFADHIAAWGVPVIAMVGLLVFFLWLFLDRFHYKHTWRNAVTTAITYAIATLIVSCPCAFVLAVPMVVLIAGGVAARFGIIFRDPEKLETARNVTDIVFNKTGTLTCGYLTVVGEDYYDMNAARTKGLLLGLLKDVTHPVSAGILRHLERDMRMNPEKNIKPLKVTDVTSVPGEGTQGICADSKREICAGNPAWLHVEVAQQASTLFCVKIGGVLSASFKLVDRPRRTAGLVVEKLLARGIEVHMISGDNQGAVDSTAHSLHILKKNTKARCKSGGKTNYVKTLQKSGKVVMFVGDGTNDSVALKQADVGVHFNRGSDVTKSAADVVLMTTRLHNVLILLDISRAAYRCILLNFSWTAVYNVIAILMAAGAFVKAGEQIRIKPQWAGLGELVGVVPVVLIAFQIRWRNYGKRYRAIEYDYLRAVSL